MSSKWMDKQVRAYLSTSWNNTGQRKKKEILINTRAEMSIKITFKKCQEDRYKKCVFMILFM